MQSNLRLWYHTLSGAHQDINKRLHFPHLFLSRPSEILKYDSVETFNPENYLPADWSLQNPDKYYDTILSMSVLI